MNSRATSPVSRPPESAARAPRDASRRANPGWFEQPGVDEATSGFLHRSWYEAWVRCTLPDRGWSGPLRLLTARRPDGSTCAVLPLATQRWCGLTFWSLAGNFDPFRAFPADRAFPAEVGRGLVEALGAAADVKALRLGPCRADDVALIALNNALVEAGWRVHGIGCGSSFEVRLTSDWEGFRAALGKKLRREISYDHRLLEREGALEIRHFGPGAESLSEQGIHDIAAIELASWLPKRGGTMRFAGERNLAFWKAAIADPAVARHLHAWTMYLDGRPVSFCFCLDAGDTRYTIANNYDERLSKYSTGTVLYARVFEDAIDVCRLRRVNLGTGDSGYKQRWGAVPVFDLVDLIALRPGLFGALLDLAYRARRRFQR